MPTDTRKAPLRQHNTDDQPLGLERDEPRNFETRGSEGGVNDDTPYNSERDRFDEEEQINTHGSER